MAENKNLNSFKAEILSMKRGDTSNKEIVAWLLKEHGIEVNERSIRRAIRRWKDEGYTEPKDKILDNAENFLTTDQDSPERVLQRALLAKEAELRRAKSIINEFTNRASLESRIEGEIVRAMNGNPYKPILDTSNGGDGRSYGKIPYDADPEHEMLLLVSDAHYPEVVNPEEAMGIEFGPETVVKRMQHLVDRTIRLKGLHENSYPVGKLTVAVLGDMLSGNIHEELEITNAMPMGDALTNMAYMLHDMGSAFAQHFAEVEMVIMPGNHPRMTKKPRNKQKWDNYEYIMGKLVAALAGDTYKVTVPKDIVYTHDILGFKVGFTHGDGSKAASFAGIPFYGLRQRAEAMQAMRSVLDLDRLNMLCMGHFHQLVNWTVGDCHVFINGAIKGGDEYGIVTRYNAPEPVQALLTFHEENGWVSTERIPLSNIV